ncbi:hypothetical protein [Oceanospirillum beijerinckii]|uniref:hypothetical protein n=1 Tax=Oceanospirillum beijerinckii TaxID=64976 RepID=UPI0003FDB003|nr:hypothetical protein [Oceanospirillum beijerinckii]
MAAEATGGGVSGFERHVQTGLAVIIVAVLGWGANKASEGLETLVRFDERLKTIESKLDRLERADVMGKVSALEYRVGALERQAGMSNARAN